MAIYFASDVHLGLKYQSQSSKIIEMRFVSWLCSIEHDCEKLFLVGDVFDFWFEWRRVVPKGFVRLFGQLARMADKGVEINIFVGNHDMWLSDYFERELGAKIYLSPQNFQMQGKSVYIAHGDNLGERPLLNRAINATFRSKTARWMFRKFVHPNCAVRFGNWWSSKNRHSRDGVAHTFAREDEYLIKYARSCPHYDVFIFGHLHTPTIYPLDQTSMVVILGEWIVEPTYAKMQNGEIELVKFCSNS